VPIAQERYRTGYRRGLLALFFLVTGGRPMRHLCNIGGETFGFPRCPRLRDEFTGKEVHRFADGFDRIWLARHRWSWFRISTRLMP